MFSLSPPSDWLEVGRGGRGNEGGRGLERSGRIPEGRGGGTGRGKKKKKKVRENFYPEFAQGRRTHTRKGSLPERSVRLPGTLKHTFLSGRAPSPKGFGEKLRIAQRWGGET